MLETAITSSIRNIISVLETASKLAVFPAATARFVAGDEGLAIFRQRERRAGIG